MLDQSALRITVPPDLWNQLYARALCTGREVAPDRTGVATRGVGGMLAARAELGIDHLQFLRALPGSVPASNLALGLGKSVGFGALIAFVACHFGLRVKPDTDSLAAGTTASVVSSITAVIMLDALVAVLFSDVGF